MEISLSTVNFQNELFLDFSFLTWLKFMTKYSKLLLDMDDPP